MNIKEPQSLFSAVKYLSGRKTSRAKCPNIHPLWRSCGETALKAKTISAVRGFVDLKHLASGSGQFFHFSSLGFKTNPSSTICW